MTKAKSVTLKRIFNLWFPLAGSWFLMGIETPVLSAFVARMVLPEINLAAWGSIVYPISLAVEGPIIMMLTAGTALATDRVAYNKLFKYMIIISTGLSLIHILLAFTPLFYFLAEDLMKIPTPLLRHGQIGLQIMTPWTFMIAWRRLNQGLIIKHGNSKAIAVGTAVRLLTLLFILIFGKFFTNYSGIIVGSSAVAIAVTAEALYAYGAIRKILKFLPKASKAKPITRNSFIQFYLPLALTPLMSLLIHPVGAAGMSRMPDPLSSLAAWPVVYGLIFLTRSMGFAYNEVVISLAGEPQGKMQLARFSRILAFSTMGLLSVIAFTPLGSFWFESISGLSSKLSHLSAYAIMFAILMPGYQVYQAWYGGLLVYHHQTKGISQAVTIYVIIALIGLWAGGRFSSVPGIYWAINVFVIAGISQTFFLRYRYKMISI